MRPGRQECTLGCRRSGCWDSDHPATLRPCRKQGQLAHTTRGLGPGVWHNGACGVRRRQWGDSWCRGSCSRRDARTRRAQVCKGWLAHGARARGAGPEGRRHDLRGSSNCNRVRNGCIESERTRTPNSPNNGCIVNIGVTPLTPRRPPGNNRPSTTHVNLKPRNPKPQERVLVLVLQRLAPRVRRQAKSSEGGQAAPEVCHRQRGGAGDKWCSSRAG
jgi:hypothetical protein